jgi:hypothetical protein
MIEGHPMVRGKTFPCINENLTASILIDVLKEATTLILKKCNPLPSCKFHT